MTRKLEIDAIVILILLIIGSGTWVFISHGSLVLAVPFNAIGLLYGYPTFADPGYIGSLPPDSRYQSAAWGTGILGILLLGLLLLNSILLIYGKTDKYVPMINVIDGSIIGVIITYDVSIYIIALILDVLPIFTLLFYAGIICCGILLLLVIGRTTKLI